MPSPAARRAGHARRAVRLGATIRRAAVERDGVAVVAALRAFLHAVTAGGRGASARGARAFEALLDATMFAAAITGRDVLVVATLVRVEDAVAARVMVNARRAGRWTRVAELDDVTIGGAAVAVRGVAVVARLTPVRAIAVPADDRRMAFVVGRADAIRFHLARSGAAVAGQRVAVVALFRGLIHLAVAAGRGDDGFAASGEPGVRARIHRASVDLHHLGAGAAARALVARGARGGARARPATARVLGEALANSSRRLRSRWPRQLERPE